MGVETQPEIRLTAEPLLSALCWACFFVGAVDAVGTRTPLSFHRPVQEPSQCRGRAWAEPGGLGELLSAA